MKRAVSISLGSPKRNKRVEVTFKGTPIVIERIGVGGDAAKARQLFLELDGQVDALGVGGVDLYVSLDGRDYPVRSALKLVAGVNKTPVVDGRLLKYVLERRVFELTQVRLGGVPHYQRTFMPFSVDRIGLAEAVNAVSGEVIFGDLMFMLHFPYPIRGIGRLKRLIHTLMPIMGYLPMAMLYPPGAKDEPPAPKFQSHWEAADLIAGDMHYIRKYASERLGGKTIVTNTTTEENIEMLRLRGVKTIITTTPRYEGRSFGINMMEAALTAYAGLGRPLQADEMSQMIDELKLTPEITQF